MSITRAYYKETVASVLRTLPCSLAFHFMAIHMPFYKQLVKWLHLEAKSRRKSSWGTCNPSQWLNYRLLDIRDNYRAKLHPDSWPTETQASNVCLFKRVREIKYQMFVHLKAYLCTVFICSIHLYVAFSKRRYNKVLTVFSPEQWSYRQYLFISVFFPNLKFPS